MSERKSIAVIGGGMAGLTAAYRLAQTGHAVTLWERGRAFGGQAAAFSVGDGMLEHFYHHLFQSDADIVALMDELGIGDRLLWLPSNVGYFADGKLWPLNGAKDLLGLGFLSPQDRIRLGMVTAFLQKVTDWKSFELISAEDWLRKALGDTAYDATFGAQLNAKFGRYASEIAMVWFWGKIWLRTTSRRSPLDKEYLGYPLGSFSVIVDTLVDANRALGVDLRLGAGPTRVTTVNGKGQLAFDDGSPDQEFDAVIATVPSNVFARLAPDLPADYQGKLHGLDYEAAVVALLELDQPLTDIYWLNIADPDLPFTAVIEHTNFVPASHYGGNHYVYLSKYLEPDDLWFSLPDDELLARYEPHLQKLNPAFRSSWIQRSWVFREHAAQPIIRMNYSDRIPDHRTPLAGLYLANTTQIYPEDRGTNYSVRLGNQIAELVAGDLARR